MSRPLHVFVAVPLLVAVCTGVALAQAPAAVRVVSTADIVRWFPSVPSDVLATVEPGTTLEVIGQEQEWYWVVTPRDAQGSRRGGWIAARNVEPAPPQVAARVRRQDAQPASPSAAANAAAPAAPPAPREPTRTPDAVRAGPVVRDEAPADRPYEFEDVLFDLDRSAITPDAALVLDRAAAALLNDTLLRLTLEGHTCNLGTSEYNLALGNRRATAARDYLVEHGIAAERLSTVSFGEERPSHDNSTEDTRRLNRRVVLVPRPATTTRATASR
jgi:outer membrane protein OmpA-like peptidoglycan-associated protein